MGIVDDIKRDREAGTPQEWTAERTNCRDLPEVSWAIVWDKTPGGRKNDDGTTNYSLRIPVILASDWLANPEEALTDIADALNLAERVKPVLLAAEELAEAVDQERNMVCQDMGMQADCAARVDRALTAYRKATEADQ